MNTNFRIDVVGDLEFEDLIADIYYEDQFIAMLTQEKGFENLRIQIYPPAHGNCWDFPLNEFEKVVQKAKQRLWELRKIPEEDSNNI